MDRPRRIPRRKLLDRIRYRARVTQDEDGPRPLTFHWSRPGSDEHARFGTWFLEDDEAEVVINCAAWQGMPDMTLEETARYFKVVRAWEKV